MSARTDRAFMEFGTCNTVDPEVWFPEKGGNANTAKAICLDCPVFDECRAYALAAPAWLTGVWAAMTADDREKIRLGSRPASPKPKRRRGPSVDHLARAGMVAG